MPAIKTSLLVTALFVAGGAVAAPPVIVTQGNGSAAACAGCHGLDGSGNASQGAAVLAQLPIAYFIKQLNDFKSGARSHPVMTSIAEALNADEIAAAAKYFSGLPRPKISGVASPKSMPSDNRTRGENLARNGSWGNGSETNGSETKGSETKGSENRQIPACFKCHGEGGQGGKSMGSDSIDSSQSVTCQG